MYQVVINDKYYVSDIEGNTMQDLNSIFTYIENITLTINKCDAKFFEYENEAQFIAEQIDGKVIEYIEKKDIEVDFKCNIDLEKVCEQIGKLKK